MLNVRVDGQTMNGILQGVSKIVGKKSDKTNIRFVPYGDGFKMQAISNSVGFEIFVDAVITGDLNPFCVESETLISFFKNHTQDVGIDVLDNQDLVFKYDGGMFITVWENDNLFPEMFYPAETYPLVINTDFFMSFIKRSFDFVGIDEFRPVIETVYLNIKHDMLDVVSTNLNSMFVGRTPLKWDFEERGLMIGNMAAFLVYYFADKDMDMLVYSDDRRTYIKFNNVLIFEQKREGRFMPYERVVNAFNASSSVIFDKDVVLKSVVSVGSVSDFVVITVGDNRINIAGEDAGRRKKMIETHECDQEGEGFSFTIKRSNLVDSIKNMDKGKVIMEWCDNFKNMKIYNKGKKNVFILNQSYQNI